MESRVESLLTAKWSWALLFKVICTQVLCRSLASHRDLFETGTPRQFILSKQPHSLLCVLTTHGAQLCISSSPSLSALFCSVHLLNIIWQLTFSGPQPQHPCIASLCQKLYFTSQALDSLPAHPAWRMSTSLCPLPFPTHSFGWIPFEAIIHV